MSRETVAIGAAVALWVGLEAAQGVPVKAVYGVDIRKGYVKHTINRAYGQALKRARTKRKKVAPGTVEFSGSFDVEITPEQGFVTLMQAWAPVSTTGGASPYTHTFANKFGGKTVTLICLVQFGNNAPVYHVYPGCRIKNISKAINKESNDLMVATVEVDALDRLVYDPAYVANITTILGISSATYDTLPSYAQVDGQVSIAGAQAPIKTINYAVNTNPGSRNILNGKRGKSGTFERVGDTSGSTNGFYESDVNLQRDFGLANVAINGPYAVGDTIGTAPVITTFEPPANGAGFPNTWVEAFPNCDIMTDQPIENEDEIPENFTLAPIDLPGDASGTDYYVTVTNSMSHAVLTTPGTPVDPTYLPTADSVIFYEYGKVNAAPAPTNTVFAAAAGNQFDAVNNGKYVGRLLVWLTGANAGTSEVITAYTAATQLFTVGVAFGSVPATGDYFVIE